MIHDNIHVWLGTKQRVMVSNESTKQLQSFNTKDDAINWLFLNGQKEAAQFAEADIMVNQFYSVINWRRA